MQEEKGRKPGTPKTGGRKPGTPNRINKDLRARISAFLDDNFEEAVKSWREIEEPVQKIKLYTDLIKFAVPTLQSVDLEANISKSIPIEDKMKQLDSEE
jgi:hypothetical protein